MVFAPFRTEKVLSTPKLLDYHDPKLGECWVPAPLRTFWTDGQLTRRNTHLPHTCYPVDFGRYRSNVIKEIRLKNLTFASHLSRSLKVDGTDTNRCRSTTYDFLLTFRSNHGPVSYRFRDKRWFQSKVAKKFSPVYLSPRRRGSPWNLVSALEVKKLEWWSYRAEKEVWGYIQPSECNTRTFRTDRRTDTGRQQRPRLRIASRGKKNQWSSTTNWFFT